jgi:hypothetical protein
MAQREVVFSARDQGVLNLINQYATVSERLSQTLMRVFSEEKRSSKENIKDYERQIDLLEKKNRLEKQSTDNKKSNDTQKPQSTAFEVERSKPLALEGKKENRDQLSILRELIQTIKDTSSDNISNRTEIFEKLISSLSGKGGGGGDPQNSRPMPKPQRGGRGGGGFGLGSIRGLAGRGGIGSLAKGAGLMALPGLLLNGLYKAYMGEMSREESLAQLSSISGDPSKFINRYYDDGYFGRAGLNRRDRSTYGFKEEEFIQRIMPTARAAGTSSNINERILDMMALERGTGVDNQQIVQMERLSRAMNISGGSTGMMQAIFGAMSGTGAFGKGDKDLTRMNELAQTFTQFQEAQFLRSGNISSGNPFLNIRSRLEGTGEAKFKRDDYAAQTIGNLNMGLAGGGSPEANAIKMDILRRANPNKGYFELQAEMEKGIGAKGLMGGIMDMVNASGGDINQKSILLNQLTGGSLNKSDVLSLIKGDVSFDNLEKGKAGNLDIETRAGNATSDLRDSIESLKGEMSRLGQNMITVAENMPSGMGGPNIALLLKEIRDALQ